MQHITWLDSTLSENDNITIKVINVDKTSKALKVAPKTVETAEEKIDEYKRLKRYLEREGLI